MGEDVDKRGQRFVPSRVAATHTVDLAVDSDDFEELPIAGGDREYHTNQFRVYFRSSALTADPPSNVARLVERFSFAFPHYFNGVDPDTTVNEAQVEGMTVNEAQVEWGKDRKFNGKETLRFEVELALHIHGYSIDILNVHSDWVYVVWSDPKRGFAAQTLVRKFMEASDWAIVAAPIPWVLKQAIIKINKYHFLAGRRSWVFGFTEDAEGRTIYYLETAAIERYSLAVFKLAEHDRHGFIVNMRETIPKIWVTLLTNYVAETGSKVAEPPPGTLDRADPEWKLDGIVYRREVDFADEATCLDDPWISGEVIPLHPALGEQLPSYRVPDRVRYYVQAGAFEVASNAERLADRLKYYDARIYLHFEGDILRHRVRVGPFAQKDDATALKEQILSTHPDLGDAYVTGE